MMYLIYNGIISILVTLFRGCTESKLFPAEDTGTDIGWNAIARSYQIDGDNRN